MHYPTTHFRIALIAIIFMYSQINPSFGQAYVQEVDYSLAGLRCEKGTYRYNEHCESFQHLWTKVNERGGTVYWVDGSTGDDGNAGEMSEPWKTIGRAMGAGVLSPGDAVFIRGGVYPEAIRPKEGGTQGLPVTIAAYEDEEVIITGVESITTAWTQVGESGLWWTDWSDPKFDFPYIRTPGDTNPVGSKLFYENSTEAIYDDAWRRDVVIADGAMYRPYYEKPSGPEPYDHALADEALLGMPEGTFYLNESVTGQSDVRTADGGGEPGECTDADQYEESSVQPIR